MEGGVDIVRVLDVDPILRTLYREEDRFEETYFSRFGKTVYVAGDAARKDRDVMKRLEVLVRERQDQEDGG